jgi:putative membrane protein
MWLIALSGIEVAPLVVVLLAGIVYVFGRTRSEPTGASADVSFGAALAVSAIILSPAVEQFAAASRAVHMMQHMLLAFLVAPLLVKAEAVQVSLTAIPGDWRRRLTILLRERPVARHIAVAAWLGFVFTMIFWHLPRPTEWASADAAVQAGETLCFVVSGTLFWSMVLKIRGRRVLPDAVAVLYCASAIAVTDLVGAVMTLSQRLFCRSTPGGAESVGLTNLQDQQLAGLLMWIPGALILLLFLAVVFPAWLKRQDHRARPVCITLSEAPRLCAPYDGDRGDCPE